MSFIWITVGYTISRPGKPKKDHSKLGKRLRSIVEFLVRLAWLTSSCEKHIMSTIYSKMRPITTELINRADDIKALVDWLHLRHSSPRPEKPTMYIDLEGINLCRNGTISIFTLLLDVGTPTLRACLIDVHTLGARAFNTKGKRKKALKHILQDEFIPKVFFDVRNDSDALFAHFGVALKGVHDIQLIESASRPTTRSRRFLNGLSRCVEKDLSLNATDMAAWKQAKETGKKMFASENDGSEDIFNKRPIPEEIVAYCIGDVQCLPMLWDMYRLEDKMYSDLIEDETQKRVAESQAPDYEPQGRHKVYAPWSKRQDDILDGFHEDGSDMSDYD